MNLKNLFVQSDIWVYFLIFFATFFESLAIIGLFFPSTVIMFFIGMLIGKKHISLFNSCLISFLGCSLGDLVSYYVGLTTYKYFTFINRVIIKYSFITNKIFYLFRKHIFTTIIVGKFIGPMRPFLLLISGILFIPLKNILIPNLISILLWPLVYFMPGILTGIAVSLPNSLWLNINLFIFLFFLFFNFYLFRFFCVLDIFYFLENSLIVNKIKYLLYFSIIILYYSLFKLFTNNVFWMLFSVIKSLFWKK